MATKNFSAKNFSAVSRDINTRRASTEAICREFQAVWAKMYPNEFNAALKNAITAYQASNTPENKAKKYSLEMVAAAKKALELSDEIKAIVSELHANGLTFDKINLVKIARAMTGTQYLNADGELCERKKNKETGTYEFTPIEKWTVHKFGRYIRLSTIEAK